MIVHLRHPARSALGLLGLPPYSALWKIEVCRSDQKNGDASMVWLANRLALGKPASLRSYLSAMAHKINKQRPDPFGLCPPRPPPP